MHSSEGGEDASPSRPLSPTQTCHSASHAERPLWTHWRRSQATLRVTQFGHRSRRSRTVGQRLQSDSDRTVGTSRHPVHRGDFAAIEAPRLPDGSCGPGAAMG